MQYNIVITGFMGTGKTTVGEFIAGKLGLEFYDTDSIIKKRAGISIPEIFEMHGEPYFRKLERAVVAELSPVRNSIIATGGGTLLDSRNRVIMEKFGIIICLHARPELIVKRLAGNNGRPLLNNISEENVIAILNERRDDYNLCDRQIDTSDKSPQAIADQIIKIYHHENGNQSG